MTATSVLDPSPALEGGHRWSPVLDKLGIAASLACVVHCVLAPVVLLLLPTTGLIWSHPAAHWVLAALVLPLALIVVYRGYLRHRRRSAMAAAVLGAAFIIAGLIVPSVAEGAAASATTGTIQFATPEMLGLDMWAGDEACADTCCPSLAIDEASGAASVNVPMGSIVTLIGSVLLVLAHTVNLYGCRCFSMAKEETGCGCPA